MREGEEERGVGNAVSKNWFSVGGFVGKAVREGEESDGAAVGLVKTVSSAAIAVNRSTISFMVAVG